ncbi:MAG: hypothetical protein IK143_00800 [Bacteroidales bacterium]|nr:hypothetical protein [Bacteroidales bacterium]
MKKILVILTAAICLGLTASLVSSCKDNKSSESAIYTYGFDQLTTSDLSESVVIEETFKSEIGVSESPFTYTAGDNKLKEACSRAATTLSTRVFSGSYTFVVTKVTASDNVTIYSWTNK